MNYFIDMLVTIISSPRSGTNYINNLLEKSFECINKNGEIFVNPNKIIINETISKKTYEHLCKINNIGLDGSESFFNLAQFYNKKEKKKLIEDIISCNKNDVHTCKIFINHTNNEELNEIIKLSSLCIFIYRNDIDRYISFKKAMLTKKWMDFDSSNVQILFSIEEYIFLKNELYDFFLSAKDMCKKSKIKFIEINYDTFFRLTIQKQQEFLLKELKECFSNVDFDVKITHEIIKKQDNETNLEKKISNYEDVKDFILSEQNNFVY